MKESDWCDGRGHDGGGGMAVVEAGDRGDWCDGRGLVVVWEWWW